MNENEPTCEWCYIHEQNSKIDQAIIRHLEDEVARLSRLLTGYPIDFRDEAQMDAVVDQYTEDH